MDGYDDTTYGKAFADVYDEWYPDDVGAGDVATAVTALVRLAGSAPAGPLLELGVGTGRLALPLAAAGLEVHGVDVSPEMLARLRAKPGAQRVTLTCADMVEGLPDAPYAVVLAAYNTLFGLRSLERMEACFAAVASRLTGEGRFVVEVFVPDPDRPAQSTVGVRSIAADRVVLSVDVHDPASQRAEGQFVELTADGRVRLRPWSIVYATPAQLDVMAVAAGMVLESRWGSFAGDPFDERSERHISVYRLDRTLGDRAVVS
ncbi:MAG: class I SAM-dependent methyltransferase [Actinomycetota bacterium]|nr:MAG: class I SAM-dependent methyltransferase [Actinomycetota bacterium]